MQMKKGKFLVLWIVLLYHFLWHLQQIIWDCVHSVLAPIWQKWNHPWLSAYRWSTSTQVILPASLFCWHVVLHAFKTMWTCNTSCFGHCSRGRQGVQPCNTSCFHHCSRGRLGVQLTATKQTRFKKMNIDENLLDSIYEPREVWINVSLQLQLKTFILRSNQLI